VIEVSIKNALLGGTFPENGLGALAVLDTGYTGFLFVPEKIFRKLGLHKLKPTKTTAEMANGSSNELIGSYGSVSFPSLENVSVDGLIETSEGASEILIGMDGIRNLMIELDCCREFLSVQDCS